MKPEKKKPLPERPPDLLVMCACPWCGRHTLNLDEYRDGFHIVECSFCHFDDKDIKAALVERYSINT